MEWIEVKIFTRRESLPAISNILQDVGAKGLVEEELQPVEAKDELLIKSYLPVNESVEAKLAILKSRIGHLFEHGLDVGSGRIQVETVPEEDWSSSWKENFKPQKLTEQLVIKPTWEEYQAQPEEKIIELDPGMAFGTGHHVTTTMCISAIEKYGAKRKSMLDIGTGTGILSIAASLLGIEEILAIDIDQEAVEIAGKNLTLNQVQNKVTVKQGDLIAVVEKEYELVVANLLPHIILDLISDMKEVLHKDSIFILSGINKESQKKIQDRLKKHELHIKEIKEKEDWVTIIGERGK